MKTNIIITGLVSILLISCDSFLDPYPGGVLDDELIWKYQDNVQGLINSCYDNLPMNYNDFEGALLDGITDNAVITNSTNVLNRFADGTISTTMDPFKTYWSRNYNAIRNVNLFLKDNKGLNYRYMVNDHFNDLVRYRLHGEAYALRAWFQWDLLQKYAGKNTNGEILGFPIITEPVEDIEKVNLVRNTYEECVKQIVADCDSAYKYLPIAHRDFLVKETTDLAYAGGRYWGRLDGITTRALKAIVYLTWASPLYNPENNIARWDSAAVNAIQVINFKMNVDKVSNGFNPLTKVTWTNPNFPGIIWSSRYNASSDVIERMFYPGGFQGNGEIGASQELVDAFPMKNGFPISDPRGGYDPSNPYRNRDPRFYSTIFYNTSTARKNNTGSVMYMFENWSNGGKDAAGISSTNSLTNYYIKKFIHMGLNWSDATIDKQPHSKFFIRWAHMCLTFAEAANKVVGPLDESKYGMSAKTAIQYLRSRQTPDGSNGISPAVPGQPDSYLTEVANSGKEAFDLLIRNERRIETCFEGTRFYDLRRWDINIDSLNAMVHGASVFRNTDWTYTYNLNVNIKQRAFTSKYLPIPYLEILKMSKLIQNEGWEGWQ